MSEPIIISLIIPAYNEEAAVSSTLKRCVDAFSKDLSEYGIDEVETILVSDGSYDKTLDRARGVPGVKLVSYDTNRGYGRAIETGYAVARGNVFAFMDSDGTCDPAFIFELWQHMRDTNSDIVIGCRLHESSAMPIVRRLGNTLYAWLLSAISGQLIRDTASGMRLLKRDVLPRILPLPAGLHYTPAMSARGVLDPGVTISEINMPYEERTGESKLHLAQDGMVFLQTILVTALYYTPLRMFGALAIAGIGASCIAHVGFGWNQAALHFGVPWAILSGGVGLFFHFFSKRILPTWPTGNLERVLDRILTPVVLLVFGILCFSMTFCPISTKPGILPNAWLLGAVSIFLSAGRHVLHQMNVWNLRELPTADLLAGTRVEDTST